MSASNKSLDTSTKDFFKSREVIHKNYLNNLNKISFKNMINYLNTLKEHNVINEDEFVSLVNYACSIFIENEVEKRFSRILEDKVFSYFENSFFKQ